VVETDRIVEAFGEIDSPHKQLVVVPASTDPSNHVIAGNIMSPENNGPVSQDIIQFVRNGPVQKRAESVAGSLSRPNR
jgi:hypothetical protein